jgi:adenylyl-sulfate kinase
MRSRQIQPPEHSPRCYWMTGLSGAGKTTLARAFADAHNANGQVRVVVLDGDVVQAGLCDDLWLSAADRLENERRLAAVASLLVDAGLNVVVSAISPTRAARSAARAAFESGTFWEVYVATPLHTCMVRDVKGLYNLAAQGQLTELTGVGVPYEVPEAPDVILVGEGDVAVAVTDWLAQEDANCLPH